MTNGLLIFYGGLAAVNLLAFILVGIDKKSSVDNTERIPEVYYFFIAIFFASLGVLLGMIFFHHKTRKFYFPLGISLLILEQAALLIFLSKIVSFNPWRILV
ncbi:MAG: DUF1294 domain-containing protein [Candidatus Doudnabacteria bacterium]